MTIGRRADYDDAVIERAARRLAQALGMGHSWFADTTVENIRDCSREDGVMASALTVARRGRVAEQAAWSINGSSKVKRQHRWSSSRAVVAVPAFRREDEAIACLSFAKLDGPLEAILLLYATGDTKRFWPVVERFGLACLRNAFAPEALNDAMARIMYRRAAVAQDDRAKQLGIRASSYRGATREAEAMLRRWLLRAAKDFLNAMEVSHKTAEAA